MVKTRHMGNIPAKKAAGCTPKAYSLERRALVAQWIEHLTTNQGAGGSNPSQRAKHPPGKSS